MDIVAVDIGYANLKLAHTDQQGNLITKVFPAGAAPVQRAIKSLTGAIGRGVRVRVNGEDYIAACPRSHLSGATVILDDNYAREHDYQALYRAALALAGKSSVDCLVAGLPVVLAQEPARVEELKQLLRGWVEVDAEKRVQVRDVRVLPQPAGAYISAFERGEESADLFSGTVLVIDPGFFSLDWVCFVDQKLEASAGGSSTTATSRILEQTAERLSAKVRFKIDPQRLDEALRDGKTTILAAGSRLEFTADLGAAAADLAAQGLRDIRAALRGHAQLPDLVILAGGGAPFYLRAAQQAFAHSRVLLSQDPVVANVRGFWLFGQTLLAGDD